MLQQSPIIVRIIQPEHNPWRDLLLSVLGVIGVLVLIAVVAAAILGGVMFWIRSKRV